MLFNAIESTRENGHTLHNPWFKFIISRWCVVDDDDGMEDDLRQFYILDMLQFGNASGKLPLKIG